MKRFTVFFLTIFLMAACNQNKQRPANESVAAKDSVRIEKKDSIPVTNVDTVALNETTRQVLSAVKHHDYTAFADFIHPEEGIRFSPYGYIDTAGYPKETNLLFSKNEFITALKTKNKKTLWVSFDASDEPTHMSLEDYFKRFVYDVDFLYVEKKSVNEFLGGGNSLNNLRAIYPDEPFTENYFSPDRRETEFNNWRTLRLVYKKSGSRYYVIAVVHDEWTI